MAPVAPLGYVTGVFVCLCGLPGLTGLCVPQAGGGDVVQEPGAPLASAAPRLPSQPLPPPPEFSAPQQQGGAPDLPPPPPPYMPSQYAYGQHGANGSAGTWCSVRVYTRHWTGGAARSSLVSDRGFYEK